MEQTIIEVPCPVLRSFIQKHRELFFVYSLDVAHHGTLGQCWDCHGEENSGHVYTCWKMCKTSGFFQKSQTPEINVMTDACIHNIKMGAFDRPIIVLPKIGQGHSRMKEFCPRAYAYLMAELDKIKYPNIKWKYH